MGCLTTGSVLSSWHSVFPDRSYNCHLCTDRILETPEHLFYHCKALEKVRDKVFKHLADQKLISKTSPNILDCMTGTFSNALSKSAATSARSLMFSVNSIIWRVRNDVVHRGIKGHIPQIENHVAKLMEQYVDK